MNGHQEVDTVEQYGTNAERIAYPTTALRPGAEWYETDTTARYKWFGSWVQVTATAGAAPGWAAGGGSNTPSTDKSIVDPNADGNTYFGYAAPGTATSAAAWRIQRMLVSGNSKTFQWADGNVAYDNVWDNRTSLTYA